MDSIHILEHYKNEQDKRKARQLRNQELKQKAAEADEQERIKATQRKNKLK